MADIDISDFCVPFGTVEGRNVCFGDLLFEKDGTAVNAVPGMNLDLLSWTRPSPTVGAILRSGADTFDERNLVYGDGYKRIGDMMVALFPEGVKLNTNEEFVRWHLLMLKAIKLMRIASSGITHKDSLQDDMVYSAMLQGLIDGNATRIGGCNE